MRPPLLLALLLLCRSWSVRGRALKAEEPSRELWDFSNCTRALYEYEQDASNAAGGQPQQVAYAMPSTMPLAGSAGTGATAKLAAPSGGAARAAAMPAAQTAMPSPVATASEATLGFTTGGAQDIENFRENIEAGYLPLPTDVTFEGITKDYEFKTATNSTQPCQDLFCPIYSLGVSDDPLLGSDNATQLHLAVGLDSGIQAASFQRPNLNLVVLLDVSGSMGSPFDSYYYDQVTGKQVKLSAEEQRPKKIDVAKEVLTGIVDQLKPDDSLGVVLFSDGACAPRALSSLRGADVAELKRRIDRDVSDTSGTNLQAGIDAATRMLQGCRACMEANKTATENRIILITDAQPNEGETSDEGLLARLKANAGDSMYTTLIGVGLDFNTELVEAISKVRGANYFSALSPGEFRRRLVDEFDYSVSPLVFDLALQVEPSSLVPDGSGGTASPQGGWRILHVYGSPNPNDTALSSDGTIMQVRTLFPSPKTEEGIKGGVVLMRLAPPAGGANTPLRLAVSYTDRQGQKLRSERTVAVPPQVLAPSDGAPYFDSNGVEKAVLLARYTDILQSWLLDQWASVDKRPIVIPAPECPSLPRYYCPVPVELYGWRRIPDGCALDTWLRPDACILPPPWPVLVPLLGRWERQSQKLAVGGEARDAFKDFIPYFQAEMQHIGDSTLQQELDILQKLTA